MAVYRSATTLEFCFFSISLMTGDYSIHNNNVFHSQSLGHEVDFLRPDIMEERYHSEYSSDIQEVDRSVFFVYTNETKDTDIPNATLTHLRIDSSVREIPERAFQHCLALVQVELPETLTSIGELAFYGCVKLKSIRHVSRNDDSPETCPINPHLEDRSMVFLETEMVHIENVAISSCHSLRKLIVCSTATKLGEGAFSRCSCLTSVELPEGLQAIEPWLFGFCRNLTTVKIPSSVIKIGDQAFEGCESLTSVQLSYGLLEIGARSFTSCCSIETLHIPPTVSTIGLRAFQDCRSLKHLKLPPSLKRIEPYLCCYCERLEYIEIPSTVSFIGMLAFAACDSLTHIRIPPSVSGMHHWAFACCHKLISIELPEGILLTRNDGRITGQSFSCSSLVNLAIPTLPIDNDFVSRLLYNNSKLGSVVDRHDDLAHKLKHRFDSSPLNELCYYQSYHSSAYAMRRLHILTDENPLIATTQVDEFGMTPLHVLSLSQTPNLDMLLALMNAGNEDQMFHCQDSFGSTPMDYLCWNRMPNSTEVIRRVLQKHLDRLNLDRSWKSEMVQVVDKALEVDWSSRRREIGLVYFKLARHELEEILSLVELYLWKTKIDDIVSREQSNVDRESCRINCGASAVIPHVLSFLGNVDMKDFVSTSLDQGHAVDLCRSQYMFRP
eukprot:scaffold9646_cov133-Cylindrotheca_fusiformis.AAC.9